MTAGQALAEINAAWTGRGEPRFEPSAGRNPLRFSACSEHDLCVQFIGPASRVDAISLTGPADTRDGSARYLSAQSLLVRLTAPGAPPLPAVTADRVAVAGSLAAEAQLGPTCMRVKQSDGHTLSTTFSRRRCAPG